MNRREMYEKLRQRPASVRFEEICRNAVDFGFIFKGGKGSHRIFVKEGIREILNFQNVKGMVKAYQSDNSSS